MGAPAARVSELARHWVRLGHQVTVLAGFPNHPTGVVYPEYMIRFRHMIYQERAEGVRVVRTWLYPLPNRKPHERILNYSSFCLSSCITGSFLPRPDIIIATSPQLLVGLTGWWLGLIKHKPFILEVRDIWPESIIASGVGQKTSMMTRSLSALSGFLYRTCTHLVPVTPAFKEDIVNKFNIKPEKISVVTNGVETDLFRPMGDTNEAKGALGLEGRFVVSVIGTLGLAHGLDTVIQAAARLKENFSKILFLFVGEGADRERLMNLSRDRGLNNIRFLPQQPREKVPEVINASDICLVMLKKAEVFKTVIPTKMLEFMACGRPLILGVDGQARHIMEQARAGIFVEPENVTALAKAVTELYYDEERRERLGTNGRDYIVKNLSRKQTAKEYVGVLEKVVSRWKEKRR
jgi:colanic acid biosynthesis glycosyl transferase WcaI